MSSLLWGSRCCRNSALTGGTAVSLAPAMICTGAAICGSRSAGRQLGRVGADVAHRLGDPVALVGRQVVLPDGVGQPVPPNAGRAAATICRGSAARKLSRSGASTQSFSRPPSRSGTAAPPLPTTRLRSRPGCSGGGEQRGRGADVGADDMRVLQPEGVGGANDELAHRLRGQQRVVALGMAESGQIDRHQVGACWPAATTPARTPAGSLATGSAAARDRRGPRSARTGRSARR